MAVTKYQVAANGKVLGYFPAHSEKEAVGKAIAANFVYHGYLNDPDTEFTVQKGNEPAVTFARKDV